jgi:hypothetical protein
VKRVLSLKQRSGAQIGAVEPKQIECEYSCWFLDRSVTDAPLVVQSVTILQALPHRSPFLVQDDELAIGYEVVREGLNLVYELREGWAHIAAGTRLEADSVASFRDETPKPVVLELVNPARPGEQLSLRGEHKFCVGDCRWGLAGHYRRDACCGASSWLLGFRLQLDVSHGRSRNARARPPGRLRRPLSGPLQVRD